MLPQESSSTTPPQPSSSAAGLVPSSSPVAAFPQKSVGFTVGKNGDIETMPTRFTVASHEIVHWLVGNKSGERITVSLLDFFRGTTPVVPLAWLVSESVEIEAGKVGLIAGIRNPDYVNQNPLGDRVKYTIRVQGHSSGFDESYDPDGDIKP